MIYLIFFNKPFVTFLIVILRVIFKNNIRIKNLKRIKNRKRIHIKIIIL